MHQDNVIKEMHVNA